MYNVHEVKIMEQRTSAGILLPVITGLINSLKELPLTGEYEEDSDGITMQCVEFPDEFENAPTLEEARVKLVKGLKGWAEALASDYEKNMRGYEEQKPYLFKILFSSEEELLSCLKSVKSENI